MSNNLVKKVFNSLSKKSSKNEISTKVVGDLTTNKELDQLHQDVIDLLNKCFYFEGHKTIDYVKSITDKSILLDIRDTILKYDSLEEYGATDGFGKVCKKYNFPDEFFIVCIR